MADNRTKPFVWPKYVIPGLQDINEWNMREYKLPWRRVKYSAGHSLGSLAAWMAMHLREQKKFDVLRIGDGEMLLLGGKIKGNLIKRHKVERILNPNEVSSLTKYAGDDSTAALTYSFPSMQSYWSRNEISNMLRAKTKYDVYSIYQLIASGILTRLISNKSVTVLAAGSKCELIRQRLNNLEFQNFLGIKGDIDFVHIDQRGCVQNLKLLEEAINNCKTDVVLYGMGVAKLFVCKSFSNSKSSFIDIGAGIDALAGIIPKTRPYFANWNNFDELNASINFPTDLDILSR